MSENSFVVVIKENEQMSLNRNICNMSSLLKSITDNSEASEEIPLEGISKEALELVVRYCEYHAYQPQPRISKQLTGPQLSEIISNRFDLDFISNLSLKSLIDLIHAAEYLDIPCLLDLGCACMATQFMNKDLAEIQAQFEITEDFTVDEEDRIRSENPWIYNLLKTQQQNVLTQIKVLIQQIKSVYNFKELKAYFYQNQQFSTNERRILINPNIRTYRKISAYFELLVCFILIFQLPHISKFKKYHIHICYQNTILTRFTINYNPFAQISRKNELSLIITSINYCILTL